MGKALSLIGRLVVSACLVFLLLAPAAERVAPFFPVIDAAELLPVMRSAHPGHLFPALIFFYVGVILLAWRWRVIIGPEKAGAGFILKLTLYGFFFNNFLPTGAGGDLVKGYYLVRGRENKLDLGFSVLIDRLVGSFSIMAMGAVAVILYRGRIAPGLAWPVLALFTVLLAVLLISFFISSGKRPVRVLSLLPRGRAGEAARKSIEALGVYFRAPKSFARALVISLLSQLMVILTHYFFVLSLGGRVPPAVFFVAVPLVWSVMVLPSLGGLGVREVAYVVFFRDYLVREEAFALALMILAANVVTSLAGGVVYLFSRADK